MTEALVGEKDTETRTNMVEMVIVALLKVFTLFTFFFLNLLLQLPSDQFFLEEICRRILPAVQDSKSRWASFSYSAIPPKVI